jgi:hypothetical protein
MAHTACIIVNDSSVCGRSKKYWQFNWAHLKTALASISSTCLCAAFSHERQKLCLFLKINFTMLFCTKIVLVVPFASCT